MPLPKTDEEIMASYEKILDTQNRNAEWDAHSKLIKQAWPDPDNRGKYLEWSHTWNGRIFVRNKYIMNTEDYIEMISQTDFLDIDKVERLSRDICVYPKPFVAIGETHFGCVFSGYAFTPMADFLEPKYPDSGSDVLGNMILALNIPLPQSPPLSPGSSVHSSDTDSDSNSSVSTELSHSFPSSTTSQLQSPVCAESSGITRENTLGSATSNVDLQTLLGDCSGPLLGTGRKLVRAIRMTTNGDDGTRMALQWWCGSVPRASLVKSLRSAIPTQYLNWRRLRMTLLEAESQRRTKRAPHTRGFILKHYNPGHPHPKSDSSFSIAKIANSILELGSYKRQFYFEVLLSNEPQIVNAKMWVYGLDGPALMPVCEPDEIDI
ncbi:hypothetical protein FPRO05_01151 [Fusarium proliferatum]|uniref:Uncharacterized protein n=1 Tax=Gibberella intermedia TaxID=948311 RepID=A0A365NPP4_GIBIN|nr:hypothetical protein FPRO05_01151 [Fusarium proliferatum]